MNIEFATISWGVLWLIVAGGLAIVEVITFMVAGLCLAVGALGAMTAALCGASPVLQVTVLAAVSLITFVAVNPIKRYFKAKSHGRHEPASNMDALIGREISVSDSDAGRARVDGDNWQVRATDGTPLMPGQRVRIVGHESIVLLVKPIEIKLS